uniref:Uncharacterized protein n=1 Tax=Candidatus Kentrum sp. LFY TaxID=2126342 RepID=A0A450WCR7_9GAMM|nr:MAG: hypothetical protein BECKLFY1418C_GA0070996_101125 [Candidatus Kentron sp. LFY]
MEAGEHDAFFMGIGAGVEAGDRLALRGMSRFCGNDVHAGTYFLVEDSKQWKSPILSLQVFQFGEGYARNLGDLRG